MVRRKNSPLYDSFLLCRNSIRKDLSHTAHKRRNARFNGLWWVNTPPHPPNRAQRLTRRNAGYFRWGCYLYPRSVLRGSENLRGRVSEPRTLPLSGLGQVCSRRVQRACGTAMRSCASLSRGVAAPPGCVIFSVSVEIYGFTPRAQGFLYVRGGDGITTLGVLCVLLKRRTAACQNGSFAVF